MWAPGLEVLREWGVLVVVFLLSRVPRSRTVLRRGPLSVESSR